MRDPIGPLQNRPRSRKPHRILGKGVMWLLNAALALTTVMVLSVGAAVFYMKSYPVTAPDWARDRIETRLAEVLPQARLRFGEVAVLMDEGWRPRLRLRDVALNTPTGAEIARFNEVSAVFAGAPLLDGRIQPRQITLTGIVASLKRDRDGSVSLQSGESGLAPARQAATLPDLIGEVDNLLESPALADLRGVELRAVTLRYEDARAERAWTVDGGRLLLGREGDTLTLGADVALLSGGAGAATLSANYTSQIGARSADFGVTFEDVAAGDIAAQGPAFAWLGVLQAPISGAVRSGLDEGGQLTPVAASFHIGAGAVRPNDRTTPIPFEGARSYFTYDPAEMLLRFDELSVQSRWITGQASGTASLGIDPENGKLADLIGQIRLQDLSANPADLYPEAVRLSVAESDFRLKLDPLRVEIGRLQISDEGRTLLVDGKIAADPAGWRVALDGSMDGLAPERLLALWPEGLGGNTRKWLSENLQAGQISDIDLALRRAPGRTPQTYLAFDYAKADVRYFRTLPPVTGASGHFSLDANRMVVTVSDGIVTPESGGEIAMRGSSFIIPDVTVKPATPAVVRLQARAPIEATLSLLNTAPMSLMDKARLPVALAEGQADVTATLSMNLQPGVKPKIAYFAEGSLTDLRTDVLVKNRTVTADRFRLEAENTALRLSGAGRIDGVPFDARYTQPLGPGAGPGRLRGEVTLSEAALKTFGVSLPPGSVSGQGPANFDLTLARGAPPSFDLSSDLRGLRVSVPQVGWTKSAGQTGSLEISGRLAAVPQIDRIAFSGPGLSASGDIRFNADKTLERVRFDQLKVGSWLDVPVDLVGRGAGNPLQVVLRGGRLDLRRAEFGAGGGGGPGAPPMEIALDRLQISDTIALTDMRGTFGTAGGLDGAFDARLNGAAPVRGRVVPQQGRSAVRLVSGNAGEVLRAAGILRQIAGGELSLVLLPVGSGGAFDGRLTVQGVKVRDAPGIAALLNAVSVVGLVNELNGDGIYFDDVEAVFRLADNRLTLTEASAVGASMGISMDGTYALDSGQLAMQGVVSPVYLLNGIGSLFTRKGEGLIGFNYTLSGPAKEPKVAVNPLSALTPAMFREIFRAPPPDLPAVEGVTESTLPEPAPTRQRPVARRPEGR